MAKYEGTQAISRAFQLLKMFDDEHPEWALADLVEASAFKKTTAFRMLSALEYEGVLQRSESGDYQLGSELIVLGGRAMRSNRVRSVAQPHLKQLARQTTESTTLDVLWMDEDKLPKSMVIDEVLGQHLLGMAQYVGVRFPAHTTSTGKVLLAWQPPALLEEILPETLPRKTERTIVSAEILLTQLTQIRQRGFAMAMHELEMGVMATAAPIFDQHGDIQAAISVGGPSSRISPQKLEQYGRFAAQTANAISTQLGYREAP